MYFDLFRNACQNQVNSQLKRAKMNPATSTQLKIPVEQNPDVVLNLKKYTNETNLPLKKRKVVIVEECQPIKVKITFQIFITF